VWEGDLTDKDKALQLLLITDFMADWARDYYREMIRKGLKNLAESSGLELVASHNSDILSRVNSWRSDSITDTEDSPPPTPSGNAHISLPRDDLLPSRAFLNSTAIQMPQELQLQQAVDHLLLTPRLTDQGTTQSLPESQIPSYDYDLPLGNNFPPPGTALPASLQIATESPPLTNDSNSGLLLGSTFPSVYRSEPLPSTGEPYLPWNNQVPEYPQMAHEPQQGQPYLFSGNMLSAGFQDFAFFQHAPQPQPETHPTARPLSYPQQQQPERNPTVASLSQSLQPQPGTYFTSGLPSGLQLPQLETYPTAAPLSDSLQPQSEVQPTALSLAGQIFLAEQSVTPSFRSSGKVKSKSVHDPRTYGPYQFKSKGK
jgi:hypothetical protein